jgi:DNA-binding MarR family transcriptional regulator
MAKPRWLNDKQQRAWRGYRRMRTLLDLQLARDLSSDSGLSDSDYDVLSTLSEHPEHRWRANELAERLLWSTSRLAHHVGRMERRGLVARVACEDDGRGATIVLTTKGMSVLKAAAPLHVESVRRNFIDLLEPDELEALGRITEKVIGQLALGDTIVTTT